VLEELAEFLCAKPNLDFITFSGWGEPTLHSGIGEILRFLKTTHPQYRTALLTNAMHFPDVKLREEVLSFDMILPSLDAASQTVFAKINRGCPELRIEEIVDALASFRDEFSGAIWLEIFVVPGINDTDEELRLLMDAAERIRPDRIQFNSLDRPGTESWVKPASGQRLAEIRDFFGQGEIVAKVPLAGQPASPVPPGQIPARILATIRRRPSTIEDLCMTMGLTNSQVTTAVADLKARGTVIEEGLPRGVFYRAVFNVQSDSHVQRLT